MSVNEIKCQCGEIDELDGRMAEDYARQHLKKIFVDGVTWGIHYECPQTGIRWVMDFPQSEAQGGGPPKLKKQSPFN